MADKKMEDAASLHDEKCADCGEVHDHQELILHAACHIESPPWAVLEQATLTLRFECSECGSFITRIPIAHSDPEDLN